MVSDLASGEVYKSFNIWVGNGGYGTSDNIENPAVCFKVEKSWIQDKKIDQPSITLNRYSDKKWKQLPVNLLKEDDKFLYFTAKTPGFSSFAITGKSIAIGNEIQPASGNKTQSAVNETQNKSNNESLGYNNNGTPANLELMPGQNQSPSNFEKENPSIPGFGIGFGIVCIFGLFLYKRK